MEIANDTFTDTNGTALTSHTPDSGGSWTAHPDGNSPTIQTNRAVGSNGLAYHSADASTDEHDVLGRLVVLDTGAGNPHGGVIGRVRTTQSDFYYARWRGTAQEWNLFRTVNNSFTLLGTWAETLSVSDERDFKLEIRTAAKKVYVAGTERIASTDNNVTGFTKGGLRISGQAVDNYVFTDLSGAAGNRRRRVLLAS